MSMGTDSTCAAGANVNTKPYALVADDHQVNLKIASRMLSPRFNVHLVSDGQQAVEKVDENRDRYSVILMDIHMPVLSGLEATRILRAKGFTAPILAITANALADERLRYLAAGVDDIVAKPFRVDELLAVVERYVNAHAQQRAGARTIIPAALRAF